MARYLLRPFQDQPTGRTGYDMHEILSGSERSGWTVKPETCGVVTPRLGQPGYTLRYGSEDGQHFAHIAHVGFEMCRRGHEMHIAV